MIHVNTPPTGEANRAPPERPPDQPRTGARTAIAHVGCAVIGFAATAAFAVRFYPELVAAVERLQPQVLTSTALVFALFWVWVSVWIAVEMAWEWRSRHLHTER